MSDAVQAGMPQSAERDSEDGSSAIHGSDVQPSNDGSNGARPLESPTEFTADAVIPHALASGGDCRRLRPRASSPTTPSHRCGPA